MRRIVTVLLALLLLAIAAHSAELAIVGSTKIDVHDHGVLQATGAEPGTTFEWDVWPSERIKTTEMEGGTKLVFSGPAGRYRVRLRTLRYDEKTKLIAVGRVQTTLTIEGEVPPVPMPPAPPGTAPLPPGGIAPAVPPRAQTQAEARKALCRLRVGSAGCTCTIIGPRRADGKWDVLTAAHCMGISGKAGTITLQDGRTLKVSRTAIDRGCDVCWLVTEDATLADLPYAWLAKDAPPVGTPIWHSGYGVHIPFNIENGTVSGAPNRDGQLPMRLSVSSGDSGGGIFRADTNEVVSNVCCTMSKGSSAPVWGGTSVEAWRLRPKAVSDEARAALRLLDAMEGRLLFTVR